MALENVITTLVLDVIDHDQTQGVVKAIALDSKTRYVQATVVQHGLDYDVDPNAVVTLTILRPDNVGVQVTGSVVDVDNADRTGTIKGVYAELTQAALAKSGTLRAQFKMTVGQQILRTEIFKISNGEALDGETDTWTDYAGYNLDEFIANVNSALSAMQTTVNDLDGRVEALEEGGGTGGGVPSSVKGALITLLKAAVYSETGLTDEIATIESWASATAELVSISASYSGGAVTAGTSLDSLRNDLTVIASYEDSTTEVVTGYTLSGTLTEGTQTITASYGGKTTTFTVTVVSGSTLLNSWDFTQGLTDSVGGKVATTNASQDGTGLHFSASNKYIEFPTVYAKDRTYEIDVASISRSAESTNYGRLFMVDHDSVTGTGGAGYILTGSVKGGDLFYIGAWETNNIIVSQATDPVGAYYNNSTVGFYIDSTGKIHVYKDGTKLGASAGTLAATYDGANVYFGSSSNHDTLYAASFTAFRVYDGNKYGGA